MMPEHEAGESVESELDRAFQELRVIEQSSGWARVHAIANVLVRIRDIFQEREGRTPSLRSLAAHPNCPLGKSQLRDALEAERVYREDVQIRESAFLTPSHVAVTASLSPDLRSQVLSLAEDQRLNVRELGEQARELRKAAGEKRGRPQTPTCRKALTQCENAVIQLDEVEALVLELPAFCASREQVCEALQHIYTLSGEILERYTASGIPSDSSDDEGDEWDDFEAGQDAPACCRQRLVSDCLDSAPN